MATVPQSKIDEIQAAADIVQVISRHVALRKAGKNFRGLCPFHQEKTPSFMVSPDKQIYHCFGCGKGGNVFNFLMETEKITFIEAVRNLAGDFGINLPREAAKSGDTESAYDRLYQANAAAAAFFQKELTRDNNRRAMDYLKKRDLRESTIRKFNIGYAPKSWDALQKYMEKQPVEKGTLEDLGLIQKKESGEGYFDKFRHRIIFPFQNTSGRYVGFGGRRLSETDQPKYLNSPESGVYHKGELLYGLNHAVASIREFNMVILVEGYFDLLRLVDSGIGNVVASSGTALTARQGSLIKRYAGSVVIAYDSDQAGLTAALRNSEILEKLDLDVSIVRLPAPHDPDTFVKENGRDAFLDLLRQRITPFELRIQSSLDRGRELSVEEQNAAVDEMLQSLISIPNEVRIGLYIHRLAEKTGIAENFVIARFNRLKVRQRQLRTGEDMPAAEPVLQRGEWKAEENILALLLRNENMLTNQILHQVSVSEFENESLRTLFERISMTWEETGNIDQQVLLQDFADKPEGTLLSRLLLLELNNLEKLAADCIYRLRKRALDKRYNEIRRLMQEESDSPNAVMHYMKELNEIRHKISEINDEHDRYTKVNL